MTTATRLQNRSDRLAQSSIRTLLFVLRARAVFVLIALLVLITACDDKFNAWFNVVFVQ